jgi:hypothetical protein
MAKKRLSKVGLSADDQTRYDSLPPEFKAIVDGITNPTEKSATIRRLFDTARQESAQQVAGIQPFVPTETQPIDTFFERAIGVQAGRTVNIRTQMVVPGSATSIGGPGGFLPRYFERDADLISRYSRDQIADLQSKLQKAGLLGKKYRIGVVDEATKRAWVDLLAEANNSNLGWWQALDVAVKSPITGAAKLPPKVSNAADIVAVAREVSRKVLGREDQAILDEIVTAFQRQQIRQQQNRLPVRDGATVLPPDLQVLAERKIRQRSGPEADAYEFAQFAKRAFGEAGSGEGVTEAGAP